MKKVIIAAGIAMCAAVVWFTATKSGPPSGRQIQSAPRSGGRCQRTGADFGGYGWSVHPETATAVKQALSAALGNPGARADLTLVFYSHQHSPERIAEALRRAGVSTGRICGWSSWHGVLTPDGYHSSPEGTVGLMSLRLPGVSVGVGAATFDETESPEGSATLALGRAIDDAGDPSPGASPTMILMSATYHGYEERILRALDAATEGEVPVLGGTATGGPPPYASDWSVMAGDKVLRKGLVICAFYSDLPFGWSFRGGFDRTGKSGVVTASHGRVIREIDGKPALDVYDQWSGGRIAEAMRAGKDLTTFTGLYPLCRTYVSGQTTHHLFVHAWPPEDAAVTRRLVTSADVSEGDLVYFSEGSWNILLNRIGTLPRLARETTPQDSASAALFICCEAVLKNIPIEQRDQMAHLMNRSLGEVPWIGAFTWGEQGNFPGIGNYHGNLLTSVVLFPQTPPGGE